MVTEKLQGTHIGFAKRKPGSELFGSSTMKSTESIDETAASTGRSLADGEAVSPSQTPLMDQRRRRLVRGAMAVAPLVLTLRSGALAAASCTGVKIQSVAVKSDAGTVTSPDPRAGEILTGGATVPASPPALAAGDVCVAPLALTQCPSGPSGRVVTSSDLNAGNSEPIFPQSGSPGFWTCGPGRQFQGQSVAILSSASVASMGVAP